mmetsp:Transcript_45433/g.137727  ORF Transcript_45433/g.137727 Transcript_45433/m.137727 type:complete len:219 (-) Transcript_45433:639-1295(-)
MADYFAQERVARLRHALHHRLEHAAAHHHLGRPGVGREVHHEGDEVFADARFREVDHQLQQHDHAVSVVRHDRLAPVVHGEVVQEPQHDVPEGRVPQEIHQELDDARLDEGAPQGFVEREVEQDPQGQQCNPDVLVARQMHEPRQCLGVAHEILVIFEDAELLHKTQCREQQVVLAPIEQLREEFRHLPIHHFFLCGNFFSEIQQCHQAHMDQLALPA